MFLSFLGRFLVFVYILKTNFKLLKFYKKLNNKSKKSLAILYLFNRNYFICQFENIIFWLSSLEFKEKYQNHHYPPLLNPKKINYEKINAKLAWDLNIVLPQVKLFIWGSHGCGATGLKMFLKKCEVMPIVSIQCDSGIKNYIFYYKQILYFKDKNPCFWLREYISLKLADKFYALLPKVNEAICLVRDPIDSLFSMFYCRNFGKNYLDKINIGDDIEQVLKFRVGYYKAKEFPDKKDLKDYIIDIVGFLGFHDALLIKKLSNIKKTYFLDMSEIVGDKTFETMKKLALKFHFKTPNSKDKEFYTQTMSSFRILLPININLKKFFNEDFYNT